ncbi:MAG: thiol:disulfide interchange protein DsbD [Pseudohongiellaceae bacterium]|jgi:thiol:disulfide interchange protein DsbD
MLFRSFFITSLCFFCLITKSFAQFDEQITFLPVEEAYHVNGYFNADGNIELSWQIAPGYYLYKHSYRFALNSTDEQQDIAITPAIDPGLQKSDEYFGDVEVYYHNSLVTLQGIPKEGQYQLNITSQGCADAGLCYPPRKQSFSIDSNNQTLSEIDTLNSAFNASVTSPISGTEPNSNNSTPNATEQKNSTSLIYALLLAMMGGAILNLMPCVFPILSLKVLSFTQDEDHNHSVHGISYSLGVILSFVAVAALLISLQAAGKAVGWGFQLQTPWFVAGLAYLFFVMGLSLSGFINFGQSWMNIGGDLASRQGYSGSFFTGVLATVVASPCTAPFMGTALGYAITQNAVTALSVFAALGFGMALPVLLLAHSPKLLNKIPKPGPWMETLKEFLAFPLYATTLWLSWVIGNQTGVNGMLTILLGCLLLALAFWFWRDNWLNKGFSLASLALAFWLVVSPQLTPTDPNATKNWQAYTPEKLANLREQQQLVFVNLTADWCITCLANEKITLNTDEVKQSFKSHNVQYLKGDWTNHDPKISDLLKQHGRTGIPLYLIYPPTTNSQAIILPQILSTSLLIRKITQFAPIK